MCYCVSRRFFFFFFNDTATTEIYTLSLHDALPICLPGDAGEVVLQRLAGHVLGAGQVGGEAARHEDRQQPAPLQDQHGSRGAWRPLRPLRPPARDGVRLRLPGLAAHRRFAFGQTHDGAASLTTGHREWTIPRTVRLPGGSIPLAMDHLASISRESALRATRVDPATALRAE